ncbi:selenoprotein F [Zootermopsis nevadensis]|uniref:Selenoprotein F n=1 Tax=Zootermopsis nevadensis TaxID=136037 RepID=A0A067QID2_ZOONE|nr:selenoprotein F [Zootermopsis nevadensis]KDR06683.1 15 kDa selenoprotein [Zootermopsis nevadensis]
MAYNVLVVVLLTGVLASSVLTEFSAEDCWSLGLNKANLLCSSCDSLPTFDLDILKDHCNQCCHRDESGYTVKRYAQARLEVCTCKFGVYPQIQAFVKSDRPAKFPNLQIKYVRGLDPIITLMDKDGNVQDVLAIDKWNTDSVEEFLKTHLISDSEENNDFLKTNMV